MEHILDKECMAVPRLQMRLGYGSKKFQAAKSAVDWMRAAIAYRGASSSVTPVKSRLEEVGIGR